MNQEIPSAFPSIREIAAIAYRHRYWLIGPAVAGLVIAAIAALFMTPVYRSAATVLIASQQVPSSIVAAPTPSMVDERIGKIRQRILSRDILARLITSRNLYPDERAELPMDTVIAQMREVIGVDLVGNAARRPDGGNTIAFELSFRHTDPVVAQQVTQQLTTMFIAEDKRLSSEQVVGIAAFLSRRADELRGQLVDLAAKRREIEARYAGALPEQVALSSQAGSGLRAEVSRIDAESQGLMQQNSLLAARGEELAVAPRPGMEEIRRAEERLNQLRTVYSDDYPDVIRARDALARQRETVAREMAPTPGAGAIAAEVAAGRGRIGQLAQRRAELVQSLGEIERMSALAPQATYELTNLQREHDNLRVQYQGIREKQMEAQVAANLQKEEKGEHFMIVDAPSFPSLPIGPGRLKIIAGGAIGGMMLAVVLLIGWQVVSAPILGIGGATRAMGAVPLVVVPMLRNGTTAGPSEKLRQMLPWLRRPLLGGGQG